MVARVKVAGLGRGRGQLAESLQGIALAKLCSGDGGQSSPLAGGGNASSGKAPQTGVRQHESVVRQMNGATEARKGLLSIWPVAKRLHRKNTFSII